MLFVVLGKTTAPMREQVARRLEYTYPAEMNVLAEYWLQTPDPNVILVTECDKAEAMMDAIMAWDDVFDISVFPAITAEDGMRAARESMAAMTA